MVRCELLNVIKCNYGASSSRLLDGVPEHVYRRTGNKDKAGKCLFLSPNPSTDYHGMQTMMKIGMQTLLTVLFCSQLSVKEERINS